MKLKFFAIAILLTLSVQGLSYAKDVKERTDAEYKALEEQVDAYIYFTSAQLPLLKRMHELKPEELKPVERLGILYCYLDEERPVFPNALIWLTEAEKRGSNNDTVYYNLACVYSLNGDIGKAETSMNKALALGYYNIKWMSEDDDLVNFRTGPMWKGIANNYIRIWNLLDSFKKFISTKDEQGLEKSMFGEPIFYDNIVTNLKELAPNVPSMRLQPLVYLASSVKDMGGGYDFSEDFLLEAITITEQTLGENHPFYAKLLQKIELLHNKE
jgi:tetratricopeptide (TPR) repeat protein